MGLRQAIGRRLVRLGLRLVDGRNPTAATRLAGPQVGDTVRLRSGGPEMTVVRADDPAPFVRCRWFGDGVFYDEWVPADALRVVSRASEPDPVTLPFPGVLSGLAGACPGGPSREQDAGAPPPPATIPFPVLSLQPSPFETIAVPPEAVPLDVDAPPAPTRRSPATDEGEPCDPVLEFRRAFPCTYHKPGA